MRISIYNINFDKLKGRKREREREKIENAEYRRIKQRRLREEEKIQNIADIWSKSANIQFDKLRKLELPYQVAA